MLRCKYDNVYSRLITKVSKYGSLSAVALSSVIKFPAHNKAMIFLFVGLHHTFMNFKVLRSEKNIN